MAQTPKKTAVLPKATKVDQLSLPVFSSDQSETDVGPAGVSDSRANASGAGTSGTSVFVRFG